MSVDHLKSEIKPVFKGNRLSFKVNINSEAHLAETGIQPKRQLTKIFEKKGRKCVTNSETAGRADHRKMQKEYKADLAGFGDEVRIHYPFLSRKLKKIGMKYSQKPHSI
ncbi:Ger(x)C family spore germination C-terminal domain-containing protein [Bacillus licheniformis]|nr:Ger(x)C family spore germination C-terminal domain-containing protein [Bacillus licheniformis]